MSILLAKGDGHFRRPTVRATGQNPQSIAAADLDEDGRIDLVTADTASKSVTVFLNRTKTLRAAGPDGR